MVRQAHHDGSGLRTQGDGLGIFLFVIGFEDFPKTISHEGCD
ncbi:hypothetical protein ACFLSQ_11280 [Bacteroidota bacterium]